MRTNGETSSILSFARHQLIPTHLPSWPQALGILTVYLTIQQSLRHRRRASIAKTFDFTDKTSPTRGGFIPRVPLRAPDATSRLLSSMTINEAREIIINLQELEFPYIFFNSTAFALFKTYGIPSISKLLAATSQLSSPMTSSKRTADTALILSEMLANSPDSERGAAALARMNYLHSRYRNNGAITHDDMLYTLGLFALEPVRWICDFEWRALSDVEICAMGCYWKAVGDGMGIEYKGRLESAGQTGDKAWNDGLHWMREMERWCGDYEERSMKYDPANEKVAKATLDVLLWYAPAGSWARRFGTRLLSVVTGERLRKAIGFPEPGTVPKVLVKLIVGLRRWWLRYVALPRRKASKFRYAAEPNEETGKLNMSFYIDRPWYVKPTWASRWGPSALLAWLAGGEVPGKAAYEPGGFDIRDVGPSHKVGRGRDPMEEALNGIRQGSRGGCPFGYP